MMFVRTTITLDPDTIYQSGCRGALVMHAELAALAIEYGAILCTHDCGFARFPTLRVEFPLA